jgi:hypothetical protein
MKLCVTEGFPPRLNPVIEQQIMGTGCGDTIFISAVSPVGAGSIRYQWYEGRAGDIRNPVGDNDPVLEVNNNTFYWVRMFNDCGFVDSEDFLTFIPQIQISSLIVDECGQTATVNVVASTGVLVYEWFEVVDGEPVLLAETGDTLTITQTGVYMVVVADDCSSSQTLPTQVIYIPPPQVTIFGPGNVDDTTPQITVLGNGFGETITYQWYRGLSGDTSNPIAGEVNSSLQIAGNPNPSLMLPVYEIYINGDVVPSGYTVEVLVDGDYTSIGGGPAEVIGNTFVANGAALPPAAPTLRVVYDNSNYWVRIATRCGEDDSANTSYTGLTPIVSGLAASNVVGDTLVSWNAHPEPDVFGYNVYYSPTAGVTQSNFLDFVPAPALNYNHVGALNGYYRVSAVDYALNETDLGLEVQAT